MYCQLSLFLLEVMLLLSQLPHLYASANVARPGPVSQKNDEDELNNCNRLQLILDAAKRGLQQMSSASTATTTPPLFPLLDRTHVAYELTVAWAVRFRRGTLVGLSQALQAAIKSGRADLAGGLARILYDELGHTGHQELDHEDKRSHWHKNSQMLNAIRALYRLDALTEKHLDAFLENHPMARDYLRVIRDSSHDPTHAFAVPALLESIAPQVIDEFYDLFSLLIRDQDGGPAAQALVDDWYSAHNDAAQGVELEHSLIAKDVEAAASPERMELLRAAHCDFMLELLEAVVVDLGNA